MRSAIAESLKRYLRLNDGSFLGALYIHYDAGTQTFTFFDDEEEELFTVQPSDTSIVWGEDILQEIKDTARYVLRGMKDEHAFDKNFICKPFTVGLVNDGFFIEEELIVVDDPATKGSVDLWSPINRELNDFLRNLMK